MELPEAGKKEIGPHEENRSLKEEVKTLKEEVDTTKKGEEGTDKLRSKVEKVQQNTLKCRFTRKVIFREKLCQIYYGHI